MSFEAKYAGFCPACDERIHIGDELQADPLDGNATTYIHVKCPESALEHKNPVCTECWIEKPCECDDLAIICAAFSSNLASASKMTACHLSSRWTRLTKIGQPPAYEQKSQ